MQFRDLQIDGFKTFAAQMTEGNYIRMWKIAEKVGPAGYELKDMVVKFFCASTF